MDKKIDEDLANKKPIVLISTMRSDIYISFIDLIYIHKIDFFFTIGRSVISFQFGDSLQAKLAVIMIYIIYYLNNMHSLTLFTEGF